MARRYFSAEPIATSQVTLREEDAHHLLHVLRAAPGMRVVLFDGTDSEFDAEVVACGRSTVELKVLDRREVSRELAFSLTLGAPLPKGDRQRWLVEKAVELGVTRLVPLQTGRSQATGDKPSEKLARYVIEASKQCGRNRLMEIGAVHTWQEWLAAATEAGAEASGARLLVADVAGQPLMAIDLAVARPTFVAVGPEGGLTDAEIAAADAAGWQLVTLGSRNLRVETAAIALAAALCVAN
jgi:16S rRNA (uracil1498-N3)-methyltransferase